jgi:simple sugar transport system permease protein
VVTLAPLAGAWLIVAEANGGGGWEVDPWLALLAVLMIGVLVGLLNGFLVVKVGLNTFVVTLAMLILLRGLADGLAKGKTIFGLPDVFTYLGSGEILGLPVPVWVAAVAYAAAALFLKHHRIGRSMYAIGGNEEAARAAGINVNRIVIGCFVAAGLLSAIAGLMLTGRLASATSSQGENLVFSVLAAVVIGGISLNGGRGRMIGALSGVVLLGMVQNILILSNIESYWIEASYGLIILIALLLTRAAGGAGD